MNIEYTADTELWIIARDQWQLPILVNRCRVDSQEGKVFVQPATSLTGAKYDALISVLGKSTHQAAGPGWLIQEELLEMIATKAPGITPDYYVRWPDEEPASLQRPTLTNAEPVSPDPEPPEGKMGHGMERFLRDVVQRTGVADLGTVQLVWLAICQEAARLLLEKKKPIDLGFVRLQALPYRANWKQVLLARLPGICPLFQLSGEKRNAQLALTEFPAWLRSSRLMAFDPEKEIATWTIEATPSKAWKEYVQDYQLNGHAKSHSATARAQLWAKAVSRLEPAIIEIFHAFLKETAIPCGAVAKGQLFGTQIIKPYIPKGRVTGESPDSVATHIVYPEFKALNGCETVVESTYGEVLSLSDVQQDVADVRNGGGDLLRRGPKSR